MPSLGTGAVVLLLATAACMAVTPEQRVDEIYGERLRAARTAPMKVELASEMLKDARDLASDPQVQQVLYRKSYDLAVADPSGYPIGRRAMALLAQADPKLKGEAEEKLIALAEKAFRAAPAPLREARAETYADQLIEAGDDHATDHDFARAVSLYERAADVPGISRPLREDASLRSKAIRFEEASARRVKDLQQRLKKDPADAKVASTLVRVMVLALDRPAKAKPYLAACRDAHLSDIVANAAQDPESLAEPAVIELADWYRAQAEAAHDESRPIALRRAERYYQRFLELHKEHDLTRLKASRAADEIIQSLANAAPVFHRRVDLLPLIDPTHDGLAGTWKLIADGLSCTAAPYAHLALPYHPPAEYDFHVEFTPVGGFGIDTMILTHSGHAFQWTMNRTKGYLERIKNAGDAGAKNGPGRSVMSLQDGHRYSAVVEVRQGSVTAFVDGKRMVSYQTDYSDLEPVQGFEVGEGLIGIGAYETSTVFHRIEVVEVTGAGTSP